MHSTHFRRPAVTSLVLLAMATIGGLALQGRFAAQDQAARIAALETRLGIAEAQAVRMQADFRNLAATSGGLGGGFGGGFIRVAHDDGTPLMAPQLAQAAPDLASFMRFEPGEINGVRGPHIVFEGVNVHIRSGTGATADAASGLGNLIVGYNEAPDRLGATDRSGAHNLIVGPEHRFPGFGGFVAGFRNIISGDFASVSGGRLNQAGNATASVSGGFGNAARGENASISGGFGNIAAGTNASISGGFNNAANGDTASVSGGSGNVARGVSSSVTGGASNTAIGRTSSVTGGANNIANAEFSGVAGGNGNTASGPGASVTGGFGNTASGPNASVGGGDGNVARGRTSSVGGGVGNVASAESSSVGGGTGAAEPEDDTGATAPEDDIVGLGLMIFDANCAVCHTLEEGGGTKNGPNLFGIFGSQAGRRDVALSVASNALQASGVTWDDDTLNRWLSGLPQEFIPGVRMGFAGLATPGDREAVIELLRTLQ